MGADYEKAHRTAWGYHTHVVLDPNLLRYFTNDNMHGADNAASHLIPIDGLLRDLYASLAPAPGAGEQTVFVVIVNGAPTALTCTIAGAVAVANSDLVNVVPVNAGDTISIRVESSLNAAAALVKAGIVITHA